MKIYIRTPIKEAKEDEPQYSEKPIISMMEALVQKKDNEKIHMCYHDEEPPKPCRLI